MTAFLTVLLLVPALDQALKLFFLSQLGQAAIPLGPFGSLQIVRSQMWFARHRFQPAPLILLAVWVTTSASLLMLTHLWPQHGWCAGALAGGSFSHLLETRLRGWVVDYLRLRFWCAFNLADVAITIGGIGLVVEVIRLTAGGWRLTADG